MVPMAILALSNWHYPIKSSSDLPKIQTHNLDADISHICVQPAYAPTKPRLWYLDGVTGKLRPPYFYPTPHGSPGWVLLLERAMFKFTPIEQPMVFNIMPISVNPDGSMSATVSGGFIAIGNSTQVGRRADLASNESDN